MVTKKSVGSRPIWQRILTSAVLRVIFAGVVIAVFALFLVWFLECTYFDNSVAQGWKFIEDHPNQFYFSALLMAMWLVGLTAVLRSAVQAGGLTWAAVLVVGFVNSAKLAARQTPLLPEDLGLIGEAGEMTQFVEIGAVVQLALLVVLLVVASCYAGHKIRLFYRRMRFADLKNALQKRGIPESELTAQAKKAHNFYFAGSMITRGCVATLATVVLILLSEPIRHQTGERYYSLEWLGEDSTFEAWNPERTYTRNGFILGYLYNLEKFNLVAPAGYSAGTVGTTIAKYITEKEADDTGRVATADYNVIVILDESFYDFTVLNDYYRLVDRATGAPAEVTPNLREILASTYHGTLFSLDYGGGTANVEFEVLTGLSNYWINTVPYTDLITSLPSLPSLASWFKGLGLETAAMHSYVGGMYKRNLVYPIMGIDKFDDVNTLSDLFYTGWYVDDGALFNNALTRLVASDAPQFIQLVTMQNHATHNYFPEDELLFTLANAEDTGLSPETIAKLENYATMLSYTDARLGELITTLENANEKTVVLFFGDHAPGVLDSIVDSEELTVRRLAYETPYFIYANFDFTTGELHAHDTTENKTASELDLGMFSANCLGNLLYDVLGAQKPVYAYLLAATCAEVPVLAHTFGDDDTIEALLNSSETLRAYQMATYDLLGGEQYWNF